MKLKALMAAALLGLAALPGLAAGPEDAATLALGELVRQGILGTIVVIEGGVIVFLYRELAAARAKFLEMAIEQTKVFGEATRVLKQNEEMNARVVATLDVLSGRR